MPRRDRHSLDEGDRPGAGVDDDLLFEESPGLSLALPVRPDRWVGSRIRRLSPLRRALLGGVSALVLATAAFAFIAATPAHPPAPAPVPSPQPLAASALPSGCTFDRIDAVHSLAQCVQCDARLSSYGLLCHFRDTVVVSSPPRLAIGCTLLSDGSLRCTTPSPAGSGASAVRLVVPRG